MTYRVLASALALALLNTACSKVVTVSGGAPAPVQDTVCEVRDWTAEASAACKAGQKIAFLPSRFGNEQLPLLFAAVNCDMRYSVAMTNGGVVCIHAKMDAGKAKQDGKPAAGS